MHARQPVPEALLRLAGLQDGIITREQALGTGFSRAGIDRMVDSGAWTRLSPGCYFTASVDAPWAALAWAGVLIGGDKARLGGLAAAHLHRLVEVAPPAIPVLVPMQGGAPRVSGPWLFQRERPGARLPQSVGNPPRITVEDTVLDLACGPESDVQTMVHWVTAAVQARLTTPNRLRRAAAARHFLRHRRTLTDLLSDVDLGVRSPLELRYLHKVERPHQLPQAGRQVRRRGSEVDVYYEEFGLLVELDGRLGHKGMGRFRDMRRDNRATTDGLATLRYGSGDVLGLPCEVALEVGVNLVRRGWDEGPARCHNCRHAA
jgi:very-short-patch-repair endonuclease